MPPTSAAGSVTTVPTNTTIGATTTTTTAAPPRDPCSEPRATTADAYCEASLDRFGPLEPAPSLTVQFGHDPTGDPIALQASRIDGGVLVSAGRSPNLPSEPADQVRVAAVNHDGTIRWSRRVDGSRDVQTLVAAPEYQPANALIFVQTANVPDYQFRFVQLSLATGAEQEAFATALRSIGVDANGLARLAVADVTDRYALLADNVAYLRGTYTHLVRYDLVTDVAIDVGVPAELLQEPTPGPCKGGRQASLSSAGDVFISDLVTGVVSGALETTETGTVVARWHAGAWVRDTASLADTVGVRPGFACADSPAAQVLQGVDAIGEVRWTDPDLTHPGTDDVAWHIDGDVAMGPACSHRVGTECDRFDFVGVDPTTGAVQWTRPGMRLVAGDPADGYVLVSAEPKGQVAEPPGWVLLDDRTGDLVAGQTWDDPELFTLYPSREVSGFNRTIRAGGLVIVVKDEQVRVWYPRGSGDPAPHHVLLT